MGCRAADRVLLETAWFGAADFDALFEGVRKVPWENYIPPSLGVRVAKVRTNRSKLEAETSIQAVVHKAAAERLCTKRGVKRLPGGPGSSGNDDEAELRIYIEKDRVSVLLDLSGEPLFKRGYRTRGGAAPLRETTAAAVILHSGWRRKFPLYDPFCGSGTIAIEAAMYAWDIAPGLGRHFALERLLLSDRKAERKVREEFLSKVDFSRRVRVGGGDSDAEAIAAARANVKRAVSVVSAVGKEPKDALPFFKTLPMEEARAADVCASWKSSGATESSESGESTGFIITNPPYGRRLGDAESAEKTYAEMGKLAAHFPGWKLAVITDQPGFESFFGRKADSGREITNGAIRSYLFQYEKL
jgi:putative N6-adenine-specific DNA methylase